VMKIPGYQARLRKRLESLPNPLSILKRTA
jgi:hypothetical protein